MYVHYSGLGQHIHTYTYHCVCRGGDDIEGEGEQVMTLLSLRGENKKMIAVNCTHFDTVKQTSLVSTWVRTYVVLVSEYTSYLPAAVY